ncbi:hydrophobin-like protein [Xylaria longipes]|nr:hydrophobin-like protein [Xylaria longipes]
MQFTLIALAGVFATAVSAVPGGGSYVPCPSGLYSVPQCCATDVLGVADLNCNSREFNPPSLDIQHAGGQKRTAFTNLEITASAVPTSADSFKSTCAAGGQRARCCVIPVLGQDLLCQTPAGLGEQ